jgi:hypothetical protein
VRVGGWVDVGGWVGVDVGRWVEVEVGRWVEVGGGVEVGCVAVGEQVMSRTYVTDHKSAHVPSE